LENQEPTLYCTVSWCVADVLELRPEWTNEQAEDFLASNENRLQEMMIQRGWEILESFID
jgi:hypothetical protein